MKFPATLSVQLEAPPGSETSIEGLMVSLDTFIEGRYYWGTVLGLTDATGKVSVLGADLIAEFENDRHTFLMDYRVPLENCDSRVRVHIEGGGAFAAGKKLVSTAPLVTAKAKAAWGSARNAAFRSTEAVHTLDPTSPSAQIKLAVAELAGT